MSDQNRLVLAYSGGLDTSVAISYLKERTGKDVVAVSLDVGQGGESLETIKQRALDCGAVEAYVVDARDEFANEYCMKALKANAMYEGVYPLVSAISRPLISKHLVRAAHQFGADTISHGCTGKGNDQVRFEVSIASIDPTLKAISPIRDLSLTRDVEIAFAKEHKLPIVQTEKSPFSIDQNVWGRAIETGFLEDPWNGPTKDCYSYTDDPAFPPVEDEVVIEFKQGVPVKIDGHDVTPLQAIEEMNRRAGAQGKNEAEDHKFRLRADAHGVDRQIPQRTHHDRIYDPHESHQNGFDHGRTGQLQKPAVKLLFRRNRSDGFPASEESADPK